MIRVSVVTTRGLFCLPLRYNKDFIGMFSKMMSLLSGEDPDSGCFTIGRYLRVHQNTYGCYAHIIRHKPRNDYSSRVQGMCIWICLFDSYHLMCRFIFSLKSSDLDYATTPANLQHSCACSLPFSHKTLATPLSSGCK